MVSLGHNELEVRKQAQFPSQAAKQDHKPKFSGLNDICGIFSRKYNLFRM